jgi:hypothetical protein
MEDSNQRKQLKDGKDYAVQSSGIFCHVVKQMSTDVSEVHAACSWLTSYLFVLGSLISLIMEAAHTSETSVDICLTTRQNILEDSELHTCRHESLKSHKDYDT